MCTFVSWSLIIRLREHSRTAAAAAAAMYTIAGWLAGCPLPLYAVTTIFPQQLAAYCHYTWSGILTTAC